MTMHPELKHALDTNLPALEVIRLFTKHHSGIPEERIEVGPGWKSKHSDGLFWDTWKPLFHKTGSWSNKDHAPASKPFLSVHKDLTREVISWLCDSERKSNVYLIEEAQTETENINENYRANAFATICHDAHRFGLPLRDTPTLYPDICRLCATLAAHYPPFRRILTKILIDNTEILNLRTPTRTQFKKLIYEPWKALQMSHPQYVAVPPVIVLRWYYNDDDQLLHSIYEFASPRHASPLLWIISFSPGIQLPIQDLFDSFECPRLTRLPVSYTDASVDSELFLHHRFSILRQKHKEMFTEHEVWPSEEQMSHLTRIHLGSFDFVDVVMQFIDWEGDGGPKAHLETFLAYMVDSPSPSDGRPYCALDHFYTRVISTISPDLLSMVKQVLGICYYQISRSMSSFEVACLLSYRHDIVLDVRPHLFRWAVTSDIQDKDVRYKPSLFFRDFYKDAKRSGRFSIRDSEVRVHLYENSLRIVSHFSNPSEILKPVGRFAPKMHGSEIKGIMHLALHKFHGVSANGSYPDLTSFRRFDFRCLAHSQSKVEWFFHLQYLKNLYARDKDNSPNIVRVEPAGDLDRLFIEKCEGLAEPLDLEEKAWWTEVPPPTDPKYALLGLEAGTVLVILATTRAPGVVPRYRGYSIYTSAMLEYM